MENSKRHWTGRSLGVGAIFWGASCALSFLFAQKSPEPLFSENFEGSSPAVFSKWVGGAVKDESVEVVSREGGGKCLSISFTPVDGKFWYYALPLDLIVAPNQKAAISFEVKFSPSGQGKPEIVLGTAYDGFKDTAFHELKVSGWVSAHSAPAAPELWRILESAPYNRVDEMKNDGKNEPFIKMKRILLMIKALPLGERFTVLVDNVRVMPISPDEEKEYLRKNRIAFTPKEYSIQSGRFYYGIWATPDTGDYPWWPWADLIPKRERILCNLEAMIALNSDTAFTPEVRPDGSNLDEVLFLADAAKRYGISSIAKTFFTPYYDRKKTLEECSASIQNIIPVLKKKQCDRCLLSHRRARAE